MDKPMCLFVVGGDTEDVQKSSYLYGDMELIFRHSTDSSSFKTRASPLPRPREPEATKCKLRWHERLSLTPKRAAQDRGWSDRWPKWCPICNGDGTAG
jgi:hypothetical protein